MLSREAMLDDHQLLRRYATEPSEAAFGELVERYVNLVYSAALRQTGGDAHLAQDVAQLVFADLARKAGSISASVVLAGWLHRATRFASAQLLRTERRRRAREQEAVTMNASETESSTEWEHIRPLLDEALDRLNRTDRDALLLRFFEQRSLAEVGAALGSNEDAARKRITRALEKLRVLLARRDASTTAAVLSTALSANAVQLAPAGLAATLTAASVASAAASAGTTLALFKLTAMTKLQAGIVGAVAIAGVATSLVLNQQAKARQRAVEESLQLQADQLAGLKRENQRFTDLTRRGNDPRRNERDDLLRLRAEAEALRLKTNALPALQSATRARASAETRSAQSKTEFELREEGVAKMFFAREWMLAFVLYASENRNRFPTSFEQAAAFYPGKPGKHPNVSTDQFDLVYRGSIRAVTNAMAAVVLREKQAWRNADGQWAKAYAFADGHSELVSAADGDFTNVEQERGLIVGTSNP